MSSVNTKPKSRSKEFEYLCVDDFIENIFCARALATAFEIGLIDFFIQNNSTTIESLTKQFKKGGQGICLLVGILIANRVIENCNGSIRLSEEFSHALQFRDLLEVKLVIANFAAHDFLDYFTDLVCNPDQFMNKVRFCRLFSYEKCFNYSKENYEITKRWMRITTALTKYEAKVCMKYYDFGQHRQIMDIGGNSGEFVLQICKKYPGIYAKVFDLPLVCEAGTEHIRNEPEANRISFIKGDALTSVLPKGLDLIAFKSMLHDWPEKDAKEFITKASRSLEPGGTLLIFERGPIETQETTLSFSIIPVLLFFHSFRSPSVYEKHLEALSFQDIKIQKINLEMPFFLVTGIKKDIKDYV